LNYKGRKNEKHFCLACSTEIPFRGYGRSVHKYCSNKCQMEYHSKQVFEKKKEQFQEGTLTERKYVYKCLVERDGDECSVCGISSWQDKPIRLWVDHIDGNATNNDPANFRLICPNCDSQSETFGAKNKGNGRKSHGLPQYG